MSLFLVFNQEWPSLVAYQVPLKPREDRLMGNANSHLFSEKIHNIKLVLDVVSCLQFLAMIFPIKEPATY